MSRKVTSVLLFICALILSCGDAYSELTQARDVAISTQDAMSAWTQQKGQFYNQLYYGYHESKNKFTTIKRDSSGNVINLDSAVEKVETGKFTANTVTYHGELGVTEGLTVFTTIPWIDTTYDAVIKYSNADGPSGIGDIDLGLRYNITENLLNYGTLMSIQGAIKSPDAYEYNHPLTKVSLGDGQYDTSFDILFGKEWDNGYVILNAGYTFRFENEEYAPLNFKPSDQIRALLGGAYLISPSLSLTGTVDWIKSVGDASVPEEMVLYNYQFGGTVMEGDRILVKETLGLEQDILNLGISLAYNISDKLEAIIRYNTDIEGFDNFGTKNAALVSTYSLAMVLIY